MPHDTIRALDVLPAEARLPYGRHWVTEEDVEAVVEVLRSDWLTTGPKVEEFEAAFAGKVEAREAVAVSSGTAALHAAMFALGIGQGDEVIVPTMTFAATANAVVFQGGSPIFADVESATLLVDPADIEAKITRRTKAIIAVDYAGQPCDYSRLREIARRHNLALVADACHSLGARDGGRPVGSLADLNVFSLHAVKQLTTGEGGMITTDDPQLARRMRLFRNHGIDSDPRRREAAGAWFYEMTDLGYNYRLTDFQCALGLSQLGRLDEWTGRRREIAASYDAALAVLAGPRPLLIRSGAQHAYHLYVVQVGGKAGGRDSLFRALRADGIGVNVHYIPVHLHPYYQRMHHTRPGMCPRAEAAFARVLSLPIFPRMGEGDVERVVDAIGRAMESKYLAPVAA